MHVLLEWVGSAKIDDSFLDEMHAAGVEIRKFHQPDFSCDTSHGRQRCPGFSSSPSSGSESMQLMYQLSITAGAHSVDLSSAYFVPDALTTQALTDALKRGVKIRIITPGEIIDTDTVRAASRGSWGPLLKADAQIYEYQPSM